MDEKFTYFGDKLLYIFFSRPALQWNQAAGRKKI